MPNRPEDLMRSSRTDASITITFASCIQNVEYIVQATQMGTPFLSHPGVHGTLGGKMGLDTHHTLAFPAEAGLLFFVTVFLDGKKYTWIA